LAAARAVEGKNSLSQEMKNLIAREKQRRDARNIKYALQTTNRKGLSAIEVQDSDGNWIKLTSQSQIEDAILQELRSRFNQAINTPFSQEPLMTDIGPITTTSHAQEILKGRIPTRGPLGLFHF
jgi:hypothetical protein